MKFEKLHWIETTEYFFVAATVIGSVVAIASTQMVYALTPLAFTLILNLINRLRLEQRHRRRVHSLLGQLRQQSEMIATLEKQAQAKADRQAQQPVSHSSAVAYIQEDIASLEESLSRVVQYLNQSSLSSRVEYLEKVSSKLIADVTGISSEVPPSVPEETPSLEEDLPPSVVIQTLTSDNPPPEMPWHLASPSPVTRRNFATWKYCHTLTQHNDWVTALAISPNSELLASVSLDKTLKIWELASGTFLNISVEDTKGLWDVRFAGFNRVVIAGFDPTIKFWDLDVLETGELQLNLNKVMSAHKDSIRSLAIAPDQRTLLSGSYDQTIKIWWLDRGELLHSLQDNSGSINAIALSSNGQIIASAGTAGVISLWQWGNTDPIGLLSGNSVAVESLAISSDGELLAAGCVDGTIKIWAIAQATLNPNTAHSPIDVLEGHTGQVTSLVFYPKAQILISGSADRIICIWDLAQGSSLAILENGEFNRPLSSIVSLAISPDGQFLAAGQVNGDITIWQADFP